MDQTWPDPRDSEAWLAAAAAGRLASIPPGMIVVALRDQIRVGHRRAAGALSEHLSVRITRYLRRLIGTNHPNCGEPMIESAHGELMKGLFDPGHGDHDGLVEAFAERIRFRALDAIKAERRHNARFPSYDGWQGGLAAAQAKRPDRAGASVEVAFALARITDPRKRLAFRLYVEGAQVRAGPGNIATAVGVDPKTAARWIVEVRAILAPIVSQEIGA